MSPPQKGDNHYMSKLNSLLVEQICLMYNDGYKTKDIHKILYENGISISESSLKQIKNKRSWKDISKKYFN